MHTHSKKDSTRFRKHNKALPNPLIFIDRKNLFID